MPKQHFNYAAPKFKVAGSRWLLGLLLVCGGLEAALAKGEKPAAKGSASAQSAKKVSAAPACLQQALIALSSKRFVEEDLKAAANEYVSYAIYYWPNPKDAKACYVLRDGQKNPELINMGNAPQLGIMLETLTSLLENYQKSSEERFAKRAAEWLKLWFIDENTRMQPHLKYAQLRAQKRPAGDGQKGGVWSLQSQGGGIIDMSNLAHVLRLLPTLKKANVLNAADWQQLDKWMADYLQWLIDSPQGKYAAGTKNNHFLHYCYQLVELCLYLQRPQQAREVFKMCFGSMDSYIEPDGTQPKELKRKKDWDYSIYALRGWINLAAAAERCQLDLWNYQTAKGASLGKAYNYLQQAVSSQQKTLQPQRADSQPIEAKKLEAITRMVQGKFKP